MTTEQQLRAKIEEQHGLILALSVFVAIFATLLACLVCANL
jgi:uncharacterized membrane protein